MGRGHDMIDLILAILCAYRLTQLLTWDDLLSPVTCWLANKHQLLDELFGCPHCMGFWCSLVTVVAVIQDHWLIRIGVWAFAVSGAVSLIQHATGWLDTEVPMLPPYLGQDLPRRKAGEALPGYAPPTAIARMIVAAVDDIVAAAKGLGYDIRYDVRHVPRGEGE